MSLTAEARKYHDLYTEADLETQGAVDEAWTAAREALDNNGVPPLQDDHAEMLAAAIMKYVLACREAQELEEKANQKFASQIQS